MFKGNRIVGWIYYICILHRFRLHCPVEMAGLLFTRWNQSRGTLLKMISHMYVYQVGSFSLVCVALVCQQAPLSLVTHAIEHLSRMQNIVVAQRSSFLARLVLLCYWESL